MQLTPGSVIAGRYRVDRRVGAGGMGEVWEGEHLGLGTRVAIKTLLEGDENNPELIARFRREAKLLGRVRSDHVARVLDFVQDAEAGLVLIMEFVEGRSLSSVLEAKTLDIDEGLDLAIDLATALADLHRAKIVHRDIKPGNIIMQPTPFARDGAADGAGGVRAVLVDFGISRIEGRSEEDSLTGITRADIALGTVEYMAPEQILNSRQVTSASDVYAVGAILYRALAGRHVFGDRREESLARAKLIDEPPSLAVGGADPVAAGLCAVVDKALKKRPAQRLASGEQMLELLLPLRRQRRESDLDEETTTDGDRTIARELFGEGRASMPSIPGTSVPVVAARAAEGDGGRRSLHSIDLPHVVDSRPRAASMAEIAIEPPRARVPWGTLALAIATAFAVGAAVAVALGPGRDGATAIEPSAALGPSAESSRAAPSAEAPPAAAPCPTLAAAPAETIDLDDEPAPATTAQAAAAPARPAAPPPGTGAATPATAPPAPKPPAPKPPAPPPAAGPTPTAPDPYGGTPPPDPALKTPPPSTTTAPTPPGPPPTSPPVDKPRPPVDTELF